MFLGKGVLKICSIFTGEHPCRSVILMKLLCNFLEIKLRHLCSPVNMLHIFSTSFLRTPIEGCFLKKFVAKITKYLILRFCYGHETVDHITNLGGSQLVPLYVFYGTKLISVELCIIVSFNHSIAISLIILLMF